MTSNDDLRTDAGWTRSAWISLAVKSWRVGWFDGWCAAARVLPPGLLREIAVSGLFEDTAPTLKRAIEIAEWIRAGDWILCLEQDTHHGKGYTEQHVHGAILARQRCHKMTPAEKVKHMDGWKKHLGLPIPPRVHCFWKVWLGDEQPSGLLRNQKRPVWDRAYTGMPDVVLDHHCVEGRAFGDRGGDIARETAWSGTAMNHRMMAAKVAIDRGWHGIRAFGETLAYDAEDRHRLYLAEYGVEQRNLFAS